MLIWIILVLLKLNKTSTIMESLNPCSKMSTGVKTEGSHDRFRAHSTQITCRESTRQRQTRMNSRLTIHMKNSPQEGVRAKVYLSAIKKPHTIHCCPWTQLTHTTVKFEEIHYFKHPVLIRTPHVLVCINKMNASILELNKLIPKTN